MWLFVIICCGFDRNPKSSIWTLKAVLHSSRSTPPLFPYFSRSNLPLLHRSFQSTMSLLHHSSRNTLSPSSLEITNRRHPNHACKAKGVKLCGALASAGLIAAYSSKNLENDQPETYSMVTLVDCRRFLDPVLTENHVGFYYSAILNTHTITGGEGLWEVAIRCHSAYSNAMSNRKHLTDIGELNFLMCKAIDNPHLTPSSALRTSLISVFEEPVLYESSALHDGLEVEDYVGCASIHGVGPSVAVFDTIRDGQLDCACVYPSPLHSRKQITELVENMKRILIEGCIC